MLVRSRGTAKEKIMSPTRIPGNKPDFGDMSTDPGVETPSDHPAEHDLPDEEADKLGNFA